MKLIIGGYAQGKINYVLQKYGSENVIVMDGLLPENVSSEVKTLVIYRLHIWIRKCLLNNECPEEKLGKLLEQYPDCIIIGDEIGNGIVPVDAFEREYRERTGRILIMLAQRAEEVERIICGMGQKLK